MYDGDRAKIAETYKVSERTVLRWLKHYNIFEARKNYGPNKLDTKKAKEIRRLHAAGSSMKDLAAKYKVTISAIQRVVRHITYPTLKGTADVYVVYNPTPRQVE